MRRRIAALAVAAALSAACAREMSGAAAVRSSALGALPAPSVGLLVVEVHSLKDLRAASGWIREMAAAADRSPLFRRVKERLGRRTLRRVGRLGLAVAPEDGGGITYALLLEGSFGEARLREALGGAEIFTFLKSAGGPDFSATVLGADALALGPREVLETMRRNARGRRRSGIARNRALLEPLAKVRASSQVWGAIDYDPMLALVRRAGPQVELGDAAAGARLVANHLRSVAFQGALGRSLEIDLFGEADGAENAGLLADTLRGLIALGRMGASGGEAREWLEFLEGIRVDQRGSEVSLRASVPEKTMTALADAVRSGAPTQGP
ncbi:MAG: hypothetical protein ACE5JH_07735 [Acidobacteriota bacterium]